MKILAKTVGNPTCGINEWAPPELSVFSGISCLLIALIATTGNGLIVAAVIIDPLKKLRTPFNYLLVNLAAADLIMGSVAMPFSVYVHYLEYKVELEPLANNILRMSYFISGMASIISLIALSVDRYIAISHAISYRIFFTWRKCITITIIIWLTSIAFPFLYFKIGAVNYYFLFACVAILTGFFILAVVSFQINKLLRRQRRLMTSHSSASPSNPSSDPQQQRIHREKRITRTYFIVLICFVVIYLPGVVMVFVLYFWKSSDCITRHVLRDLQSVLISFNSCVNPIIYIIRLKTFKDSVRKLFTKNRVGPLLADNDQTNQHTGRSNLSSET